MALWNKMINSWTERCKIRSESDLLEDFCFFLPAVEVVLARIFRALKVLAFLLPLVGIARSDSKRSLDKRSEASATVLLARLEERMFASSLSLASESPRNSDISSPLPASLFLASAAALWRIQALVDSSSNHVSATAASPWAARKMKGNENDEFTTKTQSMRKRQETYLSKGAGFYD